MLRFTLLLALLAGLVGLVRPLAAGEATPPQIRAAYDSDRAALVATWQASHDAAMAAWTAARDKAKAKAITALVTVAKREARGADKSLARPPWREVLRLDPAHADAKAYFAAIGQEAAIAEELKAAPLVRDLTGTLVVGSDPLPAELAGIIGPVFDAEDKATATYAKADAAARKTFDDADARLRGKVITVLAAQAKKADSKGETAAAVAAWKVVLALDHDHAEARACFTALGTLDAALAEAKDSAPKPLPAPVNPGEAAGAGAAADRKGRTFVVFNLDGNAPDRLREPGSKALVERWVAAGATVRVVPVSGGQLNAAGTVADLEKTLLAGADAMLFAEPFIPTPALLEEIRTGRVPLITTRADGWPVVGLTTDGASISKRGPEGIIEDPASPFAAGLKSPFRLIEDGKTAAGEDIPTNLMLWASTTTTPVVGGVSITGQPGAWLVFGLEAGSTLSPPTVAQFAPLVKPGVTGARRLSLSLLRDLTTDQTKHLSADAWRLIDTATTWVMAKR